MAHDDSDAVRSDLDDMAEAMWRKRFTDQQASGLSVREWCASHDVPERQFHRRRLKLLGPRPATTRPTVTRPTPPAPAFVPLHLTAERHRPAVGRRRDGSAGRRPVARGPPAGGGAVVLTLGLTGRIWVAVAPVDARKSFDTLAAVVAAALGRDPLSGDLFVLANKKRDRLAVLAWQGGRVRAAPPPVGEGHVRPARRR